MNITQATGTLCVVIYLLGLVLNMIKIEHTSKVVNMVVAVFVIVSIFNNQPTLEINDNFITYDDTLVSNNQDYLKEQINRQATENIKNILNEKKLSYQDVELHIYEENGSLSIQEIIIYGEDIYQREKIQQALKDVVNQENINFGG